MEFLGVRLGWLVSLRPYVGEHEGEWPGGEGWNKGGVACSMEPGSLVGRGGGDV